jgi:hypothetical protein
VQTRHLEKTLSPVWDEEFEIFDFTTGDDIEFQVFDHDKIGQPDLLGKVTLLSWKFDREGGFDGELKLKEAKNSHPVLRVKARILPPLYPDAPPVSVLGSRILLKICSARGLRAADFSLVGSGASDPFATCYIDGKPDSYLKTRHIEKTLNPVWDEEYEIEDSCRGDDLHFEVFDHDKVGSNDLLGRVVLPARDYDREGGFEGDLRLRGCGKGKQSFLKVKVLVLPPEAPDGPQVSEPGSRLRIVVHSAAGLRPADSAIMGGKSDPYCICRIPGKPDSEFITATKKSTLNPTWDEAVEFDEFDPGDDLEFEVFDYDKCSAADSLGRRTVPNFKFDRTDGFEGDLKLKECGRGYKAILKVRILVLPPLSPNAPTISEPGSRLRVRIIGATGLRATDVKTQGGKSDPFCICKIIGQQSSEFRTKVGSKSLEPVWDEEHIVPNYHFGDRLEFKVFDHDRMSTDDLHGRVTLASREFDREGGFTGTLKLKPPRTKNKAGTKEAKRDPALRIQVLVLPSVETEERLVEEARVRAREETERKSMQAAEEDMRAYEAALREQVLQEQERLRREAARRAKEEADRKAKAEADRKAALRARAQAEDTKIKVLVQPVWEPGELLAEVVIKCGSTVDDLSAAAYSIARLPFQPRLLLNSQVLTGSAQLIDLGVSEVRRSVPAEWLEDGLPVLAEMSVVLTTSRDRTAKVWDALTGECLYSLEGHTGAVCSACSSPDLKYLATCSEDTTAKLWVVQRELHSASVLFSLEGHTEAVNSIAFSPDGKYIVTGSSDCTAKVWTVRTGVCIRTFEGHRDAVFAAAFTPDGIRLHTQSRDSTSKMWEVETGRCTNTDALVDQPDTALASASDGHVAVSIVENSCAKVCDIVGDRERLLEGHTDDLTSVRFLDVRVPVRNKLNASRTLSMSSMKSPMRQKSLKSLGASRSSPLGRMGAAPTRTDMSFGVR